MRSIRLVGLIVQVPQQQSKWAWFYVKVGVALNWNPPSGNLGSATAAVFSQGDKVVHYCCSIEQCTKLELWSAHTIFLLKIRPF